MSAAAMPGGTGQHGMEQGPGSGLSMNQGQMNFGSGNTATSMAPNPGLSTNVAPNPGLSTNVASNIAQSSSSSIPGAPPPYDTGPLSFSGLGGGIRSGVGGVNQPSVSAGFGGGTTSSGVSQDPMQSTQSGPSTGPGTGTNTGPNAGQPKPSANLEAARSVGVAAGLVGVVVELADVVVDWVGVVAEWVEQVGNTVETQLSDLIEGLGCSQIFGIIKNAKRKNYP